MKSGSYLYSQHLLDNVNKHMVGLYSFSVTILGDTVMRCLLVLMLIVCLICNSVNAANGNMSGVGSVSNPYLIEDYADFNVFRTNSGYWQSGIYVKLTCDLDLGQAGTFYQALISPDNSLSTGFQGTQYNGSFNADGHTITGLVIDTLSDTLTANDNNDYLGMFGCIGLNGNVSNLTLNAVTVMGKAFNTGAMAAVSYGTINNCKVKTSIISSDYPSLSWYRANVGGLCGSNYGLIARCGVKSSLLPAIGTNTGGMCGFNQMYNYGPLSGVIDDSYCIDTVVNGACAGGFVGMAQDCSKIRRSMVDAIFVSGSDYAGGFLGGSGSLTVQNCYVFAEVESLYGDAAGFIGDPYSGGIYKSYAVCTVDGELGSYYFSPNMNFLTGSNSFYNSQLQTNLLGGDYAFARTTPQMKDINNYLAAGWDFAGETVNGTDDIWEITGGSYPTLTVVNALIKEPSVKTKMPAFVQSFEKVHGIGQELTDRQDDIKTYVDSLIDYVSAAKSRGEIPASELSRYSWLTADWISSVKAIQADDNEDFLMGLEAANLYSNVLAIDAAFRLAGELAAYGWNVYIDSIGDEVNYLVDLKTDSCFTTQGEKDYQYLTVRPGGQLEKELGAASINNVVKVNCIPQDGLKLEFMYEERTVAGLYFGGCDDPNDPNSIYCHNNGIVEPADDPNGFALSYAKLSRECLAVMKTNDTGLTSEYERSWVDLEFHFDWDNGVYDVYYQCYAMDQKQLLVEDAIMADEAMDRLAISVSDEYSSVLQSHINRVSLSDNDAIGGVVGEDCVIYSISGDINSLKGIVEFSGDVWYDSMGQFKILACSEVEKNNTPTIRQILTDNRFFLPNLKPNDVLVTNESEIVCSSCIGELQKTIWNTQYIKNGTYTLQLEITDDIGRSCSKGIIVLSDGKQAIVNVDNSLYSGQTYRREEPADIIIDWPGSIPFEVKRIYNSALAKMPIPYGYGWTDNNQIKLTELCSSTCELLENGAVAGDSKGVGFGSIWLQQGDSWRLFKVNDTSTCGTEVTYIASDYNSDYITRTHRDLDYKHLRYTYHSPDGITMLFEPDMIYDDPNAFFPTVGGLKNWTASGGVKKQIDRFGNYLEYDWLVHNGVDLCVKTITNNHTDAAIRYIFMSEECPLLYKIESGYYSCGDWYNETSIDFWSDHDLSWCNLSVYLNALRSGTRFYYTGLDGKSIDNSNSNEFYLALISEHRGGAFSVSGYSSDFVTRVKYNKKGEMISVGQNRLGWLCGYMLSQSESIVKTMNYIDKNSQKNQVVSYYLFGKKFKSTRTVFNVNNAPVSQVTSYNFVDNNYSPDNYYKISSNVQRESDIDELIGFSYGSRYYSSIFNSLYNDISGIADYYYDYEDERFPFSPTTIHICYDENGDQSNWGQSDSSLLKQYDSQKVIKKAYDERGNVIWQKNYIDETRYLASVWEYHQKYNFKIKEITWQEYCQDNADGSICEPDSGRVEKNWDYGDEYGNIDNSEGIYLVRERLLLVDNANENNKVWSETNYKYNTMGNVTSITDPNGYITKIEYDDNGFMTKVWQGLLSVSAATGTDPQVRYLYNEMGHKVLEADALGKVIRSDYGDYYQNERRVYYDKDAISLSGLDLTRYRKDKTIQQDILGYRSLYGQYSFNRKDQPMMIVGGNGNTFYTWSGAWDIAPACTQSDSTLWGHYLNGGMFGEYIFDVTHNNVGNVSISLKSAMDGVEYLKENDCLNTFEESDFQYSALDCNSRVMEKYTGINDETRNGTPRVLTKHERFEYFASGQLKSEKIYNVNLEYNEDTQQDYYTRKLEKYTRYYYDELDRLIRQENMKNETTVGQTIDYGYDAVGNQLYTIDPAGYAIFTDYDNANRKVKEYHPVAAVIAGNGSYDMDATYDLAQCSKYYEYENNGKLKSVSTYDFDGTTLLSYSQYQYDGRQRIVQTAELLGDLDNSGVFEADEYAFTNIQYSDTGSVFNLNTNDPNEYHICITDGEGKDTLIQLHYTGKPSRVLYSSGDYEAMDYDGYGRLVSKAIWKNGNRQEVRYQYDGIGNLVKTIYPDNGYIQYDYDKVIAGYRDPFWPKPIVELSTASRTLCNIYDFRKQTDNPFDPNDPLYANDPQVNIAPNWRVPTYSFDYYPHSGQLKSYAMPGGIKLNYSYNEAWGSKTAVWVQQDGETIYSQDYSFNLLGQLENVMYGGDPNQGIAGELLAELFYDDNGNREFMYYDQIPTGSVGEKFRIQYGYNSNNYLTSINSLVYHFSAMQSGDIDGGGKLLHGAEYVYNTGNNLDTIIQDYSYNMRGELTDWQVDSGDSASYLLDLAGNIDTKTAGAVNTSYGYNGDLMTSAGSAVVQWDSNGQITAKGATTYDWDFSGRLRSVDGPAKWLECRYGPDKTPVWQLTGLSGETSGQYRRFVYDTNGSYPVLLLVLSEDGTGEPNQAERYFWVNGQNVAVQVLTPDGRDLPGATGELYYNIHDRLGSVRRVIDTNIAIINRFDYDPYGKTTLEDIAVGCDYESYHRFAGYKWEEAADMYNCNARWYDPELMRFISRDPVVGSAMSPLTVHRYLYCVNSPIIRTDPTGKFSMIDTLSTIGSYANTASNAYNMGSSILGYAEQFANGMSARNIMLSMVVDTASSMATGKALDFLTSAAPGILNGISSAVKSEKHHVFPKFLAGFDTLLTYKLERGAHKQFHKDLYGNLVDEFGLPNGAKTWSTATWQNFLAEGDNYNRMIGVLWDTTSDMGDVDMLSSLMGSLFQNMK